MSLTDAGFVDWRSKGRKFLGMARGNDSYSGRASRPRLDRSFGNKGIDYDSTGSLGRRSRTPHADSSEDDSDISSHHSGDWRTLEEFSVHGKQDVAEMNSIFRYLGLPGPANLGIDNEEYSQIKRTPSGSPVINSDFARQESLTAFTFPRQYSDSGSSYRAPSPQGNPPPSLSPQKLPPVVRQFDRTEAEIVDAALPVPRIQTPTGSQVRTQVENRTPTAAASNRESDGGAARRDNPSFAGFANVVKQAVAQHQSRIQEEAAGLEKFIMNHGDGDLSRHGSLSGSIEGTQINQNLPVASVRSRSGTTPVPAAQPLERARSEPLAVVSSARQDGTSGLNGKSIGGGGLSWKHVDKIENEDLLQNKLTAQDSQGPSTASKVESGLKVSDSSSRASVSHGQPPVATASSSTNQFSSYRRGSQTDNTKSLPMVLKPPPRMSVFKIPQDEISTKDILGSLAPDAAEDCVRSYFSASDDEEQNASESDDEQELVSEASSPVSGANPEQLSNGEVNDAAADEGNGLGKRTDLTVDVPERILEQVEEVRIGENSAPNLPPVVQTPMVVVGPKHPWSKGDMLGQGSFGTVYDAVDSDGMWFAVKEVSMVEQDKQAQQSIAQLMQEIELLSQFKHDNVVQYLGTEKAHGKLYIFLELVSKGSLATICKRIKLTHSQISAYTRQILKGLKYLHDRHIVHRDIKCANILVDTTGTCKLADFGMAKQMNSLDQMKSCKGSAYWMAPEVIDPKKFSGLPADIWSLGCSILEMATGSPPFGDMEWYRVLWTVGHGTAPPIPDTLSETAKDFVKRCLDINPAKRPTPTELLNHPFVRQDVASTPTSEDSAVTFQASSNTLQPISEEQSADFASGQSTQDTRSLSNGHSITASS